MKRCSQIRLTVVALVALFTSSAFAGEKIDNPLYKHWAQFKPGSFATLKSNQTVMGTKTETTTTTTLKSITPEKAVIETVNVTKMNGNEGKPQPFTMEIMAKVEKTEIPEEAKKEQEKQEKPEVKTGKEKVKAAGKDIAAEWTETKVRVGESMTYTKIWTSDDVPGRFVKSVSRVEGEMKMTTEMVLVKFKAVKS